MITLYRLVIGHWQIYSNMITYMRQYILYCSHISTQILKSIYCYIDHCTCILRDMNERSFIRSLVLSKCMPHLVKFSTVQYTKMVDGRPPSIHCVPSLTSFAPPLILQGEESQHVGGKLHAQQHSIQSVARTQHDQFLGSTEEYPPSPPTLKNNKQWLVFTFFI